MTTPESVFPKAREAPKKPYVRPDVESEQMFETAALACGKCVSGPFPQFACGALPYPGS